MGGNGIRITYSSLPEASWVREEFPRWIFLHPCNDNNVKRRGLTLEEADMAEAK